MPRLQNVLPALALLAATPVAALAPDEWRDDIRELVQLVESEHPDPFTRTTREAFKARADALIADVGELRDTQIAVEMMALVASIRDGHTTLHPVDPVGFNRWLPLAFYWFEDGVYVVSAHREHAGLIGSRVLAVGGTDIEAALPEVTALMGADNRSGERWGTFYLSSADALAALGLAESADTVRLDVVDRNGERRTVAVESVESAFVLDETRFWGEMFAPLQWDMLSEFVIPFESMGLAEYVESTAEQKPGFPLHVRWRTPYWYTYLPDEKTIYMQIGHTTGAGRGGYESFEAFYDEAFAFADANPVDKFILDIRYNSGGDGSILIPFVHKFIRSDTVNRKGRLFTITGRKTYSAATMLLDLMLKHTNTVLVGEPAGSALNSYGDPRNYTLPNSGMTMDLSSEYWKLVHSSESHRMTPVDIPAVFTSDDYFEGRDPAVDQILAIDGDYLTLAEVLVSDGAAPARDRYERERERYGRYDWWRPFDESTFRKAARQLGDEGNFEDAETGFDILVDAYPDSWRAWRDFGKLYLANDRAGNALGCLERAAGINPGDGEVNRLIDELRREQQGPN